MQFAQPQNSYVSNTLIQTISEADSTQVDDASLNHRRIDKPAINEAEDTLQYQLNIQRARRRALLLKREELEQRRNKIAELVRPIAAKRRKVHDVFLQKKQKTRLANITTNPDTWALVAGLVFVISVVVAVSLTRNLLLIGVIALIPTTIACTVMLMAHRQHLEEWDEIEQQREEALSALQRTLRSLERKNDRIIRKIHRVEAHISRCDHTMLRLQQI